MSDPSTQYSAQVRNQLAQLVHQAETDDRLLEQKGTFGQSLGAFRERLAIANLNIDSDEVFQEVRDRTVEHEVSL
ncbi:MAG: hypothetical protein B0A82_16645 [Alkalinema sp. CACIAM 70d]|nr:MAG: hypothetical protein B0A82_16645 [Alkalinema sp. CACIAM 70d]